MTVLGVISGASRGASATVVAARRTLARAAGGPGARLASFPAAGSAR